MNSGVSFVFLKGGGRTGGSGWHSLGNSRECMRALLFVFRCVAPGSALRMSERRVRCRVTGPVGKALRGGSVYTRQTHNRNGSGAEREPLGPVAPSGPRAYTQTDCSPSHPTPQPPPGCRSRSSAVLPLPCFTGLSSDVWQAGKPIRSLQTGRKTNCLPSLLTEIFLFTALL